MRLLVNGSFQLVNGSITIYKAPPCIRGRAYKYQAALIFYCFTNLTVLVLPSTVFMYTTYKPSAIGAVSIMYLVASTIYWFNCTNWPSCINTYASYMLVACYTKYIHYGVRVYGYCSKVCFINTCACYIQHSTATAATV